MNPMTNVKNIQKLNERMLEMGVADNVSWHKQYKDSAYVFIGGLPYDLTEGDILCVFSQYGEIVNINLVRDKKTGKQKGFCFLCYEDQRSTILAVDNFNGIKLGGRTIRVDHCADYRRPKGDEKDDDGKRKEIIEEGCAPKTPSPSPSEDEGEFHEPIKKKKKSKKEKKHKKDKESKHKKEYLSESDSENDQKQKKHNLHKDRKSKTKTSTRTENTQRTTKDSYQKHNNKDDSTARKTREWDYGKGNKDSKQDASPSRTRKREWDDGKRDERRNNAREEGKHRGYDDREHRLDNEDQSYHRGESYGRHEKYSNDYQRDRSNNDYKERDRKDNYYQERERSEKRGNRR